MNINPFVPMGGEGGGGRRGGERKGALGANGLNGKEMTYFK